MYVLINKQVHKKFEQKNEIQLFEKFKREKRYRDFEF